MEKKYRIMEAKNNVFKMEGVSTSIQAFQKLVEDVFLIGLSVVIAYNFYCLPSLDIKSASLMYALLFYGHIALFPFILFYRLRCNGRNARDFMKVEMDFTCLRIRVWRRPVSWRNRNRWILLSSNSFADLKSVYVTENKRSKEHFDICVARQPGIYGEGEYYASIVKDKLFVGLPRETAQKVLNSIADMLNQPHQELRSTNNAE